MAQQQQQQQLKFGECLNDLRDWFLLGDPERLSLFQSSEGLGPNLVEAFTQTDAADKAAALGVLVPMTGIANYPYTIVFTIVQEENGGPSVLFESDETTSAGESSATTNNTNNLQLSRPGYLLEVVSSKIILFTMPYLLNWPNDQATSRLTSSSSSGRGSSSRPQL